MRIITYGAILFGVLFILIPSGLHLSATDPGLNLPVNTRAGVAATIALGFNERIGKLTATTSGTSTAYSDGNYQIQISETGGQSRSILHVIAKKLSGEPFQMNGFSITVPVPRNSIQGIWYPGAASSSTNVMVSDSNHSINDFSDANYGIPYIGAAAADSKTRFAMGLSHQDLAVSIVGQPVDPSFYEFRLKALRPRKEAIFDEQFYISTDETMSWFDTAANYANWVDALSNYAPFPVSDRAYEPLYDTWYWSGDRVDDNLYMQTAKVASEVGMGLFLADAGWDTDTGEYAKWLNGKTGNYDPPSSKFSNLADTFDTIRGQDNLGIDLWLQPFAVGRRSTRYPSTGGMHIQIPQHPLAGVGWSGLAYSPFVLPFGINLEDVNLCPSLSSTQIYLKSLFTEMAMKYKPEGYWLDFIDGMPGYCTAPHAHNYAVFGEGLNASLDAIKNTILTYNPNAVVHFRARYANLNNKAYANVWQSGDSPADFDQMRLNSIRMRPFSQGVVFAADQMYWPEGTAEAQVARFIMTSVMTGVPAFGATLIYSPPDTIAMLKAWLTFYRQNKIALATGRFSPFGQLNMPNHKIEAQDRTFAYIRNLDSSEFRASGKTIFLMNATDGDRLAARIRVLARPATYSVTVLSRFLEPEPSSMSVAVDKKGILNVDLAVEQGGMAILEPQTATSATPATSTAPPTSTTPANPASQATHGPVIHHSPAKPAIPASERPRSPNPVMPAGPRQNLPE